MPLLGGNPLSTRGVETQCNARARQVVQERRKCQISFELSRMLFTIFRALR
jgi:hypothetical protein